MIERLLAAERALGSGDLDQAERLFEQVAAADDRNAIAVAGLADVAQRRGDTAAARALAARALAIDPDEAVAARLAAALGSEPEPARAPGDAAPGDAAAPSPPRRGGVLGWLRRLLGR